LAYKKSQVDIYDESHKKSKTYNTENFKVQGHILHFLTPDRLYPIDSVKASWKFAIAGDSQGYDNGINSIILSELTSEFINHCVDCVLFCGDLVWCNNVNQLESELIAWRRIMEPVYDANIPVYPCRGNHESWGTVAAWQNIFNDLPDNGPSDEKHMTYSATHKNALFIAVDEFVNPHRVNQGRLDTQLVKNEEPFVFIFGHEPAFHAFHYDCLDDYPANRDRFWNSIKKVGGRTYFSGHDHFFDHAHVDDGDGNPDNDVHQFIIGTAGAPFYTFSPPYDGDNGHYTLYQLYHEKKYGYLLVEVNDLTVDLIRMQRDTNDLQDIGIYEPNDTWGFSVQPLILLSPNGGDSIVAGSVSNITWKTYESVIIKDILIEYSTDNGRNWNHIDTVPNTGFYDWNIPIINSSKCLIRITDSTNTNIRDTSYKVFIISYPRDFEPDGDMDFNDFAVFAKSWKSRIGKPNYNPKCDIPDSGYGVIDHRDLFVFSKYWLAEKK